MVPWEAYQRRAPTEAEVRTWWRKWPEANIGMVTGEISRRVALDVEGAEAREAALRRGGLEQAPLVWTGKPGGAHFHLQHPGHPVPNFVRGLPETDFRGDGGYVLLPPSLHASGARYRWAAGSDTREPPPVPEWLIGLLDGRGRLDSSEREPLDLGKILDGVPEGERDAVLYSFACKMRGDNVPRQYAELTIRQAARACRPPFDEDLAVEKVVRAYGTFLPNHHQSAGSLSLEPWSSPSAPAEASWPKPLDEHAFHGLAGEIVRAIEAYSEADQAALLAHVLTGVGIMVSPRVHAIAGDARHPGRLNMVMVGETSKGRKGSAARPVERLLWLADETFRSRVNEGLSSGEGLIWQVRNAVYKYEKPKDGGEPEEVLADPGVSDKRLWLVESELASTLRVLQREGNTLSALVRRAWDTGNLAALTKNTPAQATGAHIGITGHITKDELLRYLDRSELASGFANRFIWLAVRRGNLLPDGERVPEEAFLPLVHRLRAVMHWAFTERILRRDEKASVIWHKVYGRLSDGQPGMFGAVTNRAEAQVLRLSVLYAVLDCSDVITSDHLLAALAVWRYAEQSARWIFGDAVGDPIADTILTALRQRGAMSRNDIYELFGRHVSRPRIEHALMLLAKLGLATRREEETSGRPREVWVCH
jgi:hypothetical protein